MFKYNADKTLNRIDKFIKQAQSMPLNTVTQSTLDPQSQQGILTQQAMPLGTLGADTKSGNKTSTSKDQLFERLLIEKEKVAKLKNYLARQGVDTSQIVPEEGLQPQASLEKEAVVPFLAPLAAGAGALMSALTARDFVGAVSNIPRMIRGTVRGIKAKASPFLRPQLEKQRLHGQFVDSKWGKVRGERNLGLGARGLSVNRGRGWQNR